LDEKREKRKEKPKLVPELPGHFRTLRSYRPPRLGIEREREREREMCGSDGTPTATVTANSRGAPLRFGDGELGWALTLSALQKISYSFLTSNLLTYLPTKSPPLPWGDGGPTVVTPPPPSPPPPPSFCARDLFDFCCAVS